MCKTCVVNCRKRGHFESPALMLCIWIPLIEHLNHATLTLLSWNRFIILIKTIGHKIDKGLWLFDASNARATFFALFPVYVLLSLQLQQSYSITKSVIAFFYISHLLTQKQNNKITRTKKRCDKIGLSVSSRVSFLPMSFPLPFIPSTTYGI